MRSARSNTVTVVAGAGQLLGGGETGRPGTDHGDRLAGQRRRAAAADPALVEGVVDDLDLDLLDGHRVLVDAEHARRLARRRAQPAGELREVVRRVQPLDRVAPPVAVHEVVPLGDQVAQRTAVVAERDTAVHAAAGLVAKGVVAGSPRRPLSSPAAAAERADGSGSPDVCASEIHSDQPRAAAMIASSTSLPAPGLGDRLEHPLVVARHHLHEVLHLLDQSARIVLRQPNR